MKRMHTALLTIVAISGLASSQAWAKVYLQNNYGKQIEFVEQPATIANRFQGKILGNGSRAPLGQTNTVRDYFGTTPTNLSIRTVGGSFYDLAYILNQIKNDSQSNSDAIIMIDPSYGVYGWNIRVEREKSTDNVMTQSQMQ